MRSKFNFLFFIFLILPFFTNNLFADTEYRTDSTTNYPYLHYDNNVGFTASMFSGAGVHYKRSIADGQYLKATFFGWRSTEKETVDGTNTVNERSEIWASLGLEYQYDFLRYKQLDVYGLVSGAFLYEEDTYQYDYYYSNYVPYTNIYRVGIGVGGDYKLNKFIAVNAEFGFIHNWEYRRTWESVYPDYNNAILRRNTQKTLSFAVGAGIGFTF